MSEMYLLAKRGLYERPDHQGYTAFKSKAGRYNKEQAKVAFEHGIFVYDEATAPDLSPAATDEQRVIYERERAESAEAERDKLAEENKRLREAFRYVIEEATAAIKSEPMPTPYTAHDVIPNGLRTVAHIKLSMIREAALAALNGGE